jgi:hypothetical protein
MNFFGWGARLLLVDPMAAGFKIGDSYVQGSVKEVSRTGLAIAVQTSRLQDGLLDMLNTSISLSIENMILEGTLSWYTIEESSYWIGITISPKLRPAWRKIIANRRGAVMHTSTRPASI